PAAAKVAVPNVLGIAFALAARHVRAAGLQPAVRPVQSTKPRGIVTAETPGAGRQAAKGSQVVIDVSQGPAAATTAATTTAPATTAATTAPATAATTSPATTAATTAAATTAAATAVTVPGLVGQQRAAA